MWIPIAAWGGAVLVMLVVLGFCAYELLWKTKRLKADLSRLQGMSAQLAELRGQVAKTQERITAAGLR